MRIALIPLAGTRGRKLSMCINMSKLATSYALLNSGWTAKICLVKSLMVMWHTLCK